MTRWVMPLMLVMMAACSSSPPRSGTSYTVRSGDTLYSIATRHGVDYRDLARWNGIGRDYRIYPGQVLRLSGSKATSPTRTAAKPVQPARPVRLPASSIRWSWPTEGSSVTLTERPNGGRGLSIGGRSGQDIRTAAPGKVVYTGAGLLGYGQLIIVKHDEHYLSAYGHTSALSVREGDAVGAGQKIATMGDGPSGAPLLYFEIRINGQPTDPLLLLPRQ